MSTMFHISMLTYFLSINEHAEHAEHRKMSTCTYQTVKLTLTRTQFIVRLIMHQCFQFMLTKFNQMTVYVAICFSEIVFLKSAFVKVNTAKIVHFEVNPN